MSKAKYEVGDKVWTVNGEAGTVAAIRHHNSCWERLYSVAVTKSCALGPRLRRRFYYHENELILRDNVRPAGQTSVRPTGQTRTSHRTDAYVPQDRRVRPAGQTEV